MKKKKPFDIYGRKEKKKRPFTEKPSASTSPVAADKDINALLAKIYSMEDDLEKRLGKVCVLSGMSRDEVLAFVENPDNFPQNEWRELQKRKESLEQKILTSLGLPVRKQAPRLKKTDKKAKKRRGKTLGGRKRWLKM